MAVRTYILQEARIFIAPTIKRRDSLCIACGGDVEITAEPIAKIGKALLPDAA